MYNKKYVLGQPIMYNLLIFYTNCSVKLSKSQLERISAFYKITVWNSLMGYSHDSRDIRLLWPVRLCPALQKFWPLADCRRPGFLFFLLRSGWDMMSGTCSTAPDPGISGIPHTGSDYASYIKSGSRCRDGRHIGS